MKPATTQTEPLPSARLRKTVFGGSLGKFTVLLPAVLVALAGPARAADTFVYFGSHGSGPGFGFSLAHFDTDTGKLTTPVFLQEAVAPAYFIISPDKKHLYTCNSDPGSDLSAYAIDPATANLSFLNKKPSGGGDPSYISLDATGHYVLVANFLGGSICAYALLPDGSLGERTAFDQHTGVGIKPAGTAPAGVPPIGTSPPRAHSIRLAPGNRFVLATDLGLDRLYVYRFDPKTGALQPNDPPYATVVSGAGPRHMAFDPRGRFVYLVTEEGCTVIRFGWDSKHGVLTQYETVSTLPKDFTGKNTCSEILMHPGGKFVYVTNRGHNSVAVFSVEAKTGRLTLIQNISTQGKTPRNCEFDPTGRWLLVTNHDSNNAVVFHIDPDNGQLTQVGEPVTVRSPFCERFLPVGK
jgi:6-phosphogluconolactonase